MNKAVYNVHTMNNKDREQALTLELLEAVAQQDDVTQRKLSDRLGVALGLANSYLKRCIRKGLIKTKQAPANRYLYYLTPKGFKEKSRLTAQYLADSLGIYRRASESYTEIYRNLDKKQRTIVLYGLSELAEIAVVRSSEFNVHILGVYDPTATQSEFLQMPVWNTLDTVADCDVYIFTALHEPEHMYEQSQKEGLPVLVPAFLDFLGTGA